MPGYPSTDVDSRHQRVKLLPLILAGPILRRTESNAVTVWVALKASSEVTLQVYATTANGSGIERVLLQGCRSTVQLGEYLHVVAVTAKPINPAAAHRLLEPGQIYAYDLTFDGLSLLEALNSKDISSPVSISYFSHQLPTFVMPSEDLNRLKIIHASCRKPHGGGPDALAILDGLIQNSAKKPEARPQQLFLTGDQIYGDDVADPLLFNLIDLGNTLLGWEENLPLDKQPKSSYHYQYEKASKMPPGERSSIAEEYGGFTAMLVNKPQNAKSHLFSLGEYAVMYLLAWSPILWSQSFPTGKDLGKNPQQAKQWDLEVLRLQDFLRDLWKVRRSLANIPTYTICDDHEISDDWYLNQEWCNRVLSKPLGRRVLLNGLLAYAVFQAWGNTPEQFEGEAAGAKLLQAASLWSASGGTDIVVENEITRRLGLPPIEPETNLPQYRFDGDVLILDRECSQEVVPIQWHYSVRSFKHEVIVLDTRTWRGYPLKAIDPPTLLSPTAFKEQIQQPLEQTDRLNASGDFNIELTLVVIPTNLVSLSIIERVQERDWLQGNVFHNDVGDAWNLNQQAFSRLLSELFQRRDRAIVLTGDIHYAAAVRLSYWSYRHFGTESQNRAVAESSHVLAQLTSSPLKNSDFKTHLVHTRAKSLMLEARQDWAGWNDPPELFEIQTIHEIVRTIKVQVGEKRPILRKIHGLAQAGEVYWEIAVKNAQFFPDWRYHIEWIERGKTSSVPGLGNPIPSSASRQKGLGSFFAPIWQNQWFQEGKEVVGYSNLGVVTFRWSQQEDTKAVIQDIYWRVPWNPDSVVFNRYFVPLYLETPPALPRLIPS